MCIIKYLIYSALCGAAGLAVFVFQIACARRGWTKVQERKMSLGSSIFPALHTFISLLYWHVMILMELWPLFPWTLTPCAGSIQEENRGIGQNLKWKLPACRQPSAANLKPVMTSDSKYKSDLFPPLVFCVVQMADCQKKIWVKKKG